MNCKQSILSAAIVASLSFAAHAQETSTQSPDATDLDTIVVTGIRGSVEKSLDVKREAKSHVEVITAEDIGKMPDKNVADSLQRVPGVTVSSAGANEGGFDENDRVSMRGTNPSLTQTLFNGHNIASGDWFVLNQTGTVGRSVSYTLLPSELVSQVVVHKSSEASLVEGGVAGSVNIITRKPLDFVDNLTTEFSLGAVHSDLPGDTEPQFSGLLNWKNEANNVGVLLQVFSEKRSLRRDGQELLGYERIAAGSPVALSNPDLAGVWYPGLIGSALFEQTRERTGGLLDIQVKPSDTITLGFNAFVSKQDASNYNRNYLLWPSRFLAQGNGQAPDAGYVVRNNTLVSADFTGVAGTQYGVYDQISRPDSGASSNFLSWDAAWTASDKLTLKGQAGLSRGTGRTPTQDVAEWNVGVGSGGGWGLNGVGAADWYIGGDPSSPVADSLGWIFGYQDVKVEDKEDWLQLDGEYFIDNGAMSSLEFGLRYAEHSRESKTATAQGPACKDPSGNTVPFNWAPENFNCPAGTQSPFNPANFPTGGYSNYPGDFGSGLGGTFPRDIWFFSPEQLAAYNDRFTNRDPVERNDWVGVYGIREKTTAGYLQLNLEGERWSGNIGVRAVKTEERITNNVFATVDTPGAITTSAFGPYLPVVTEHNYNDLLPSANLKFDLNEDIVLRLAASRTMTRPDYSALAGAISLSPPASPGASGSGSGGNPDLKPIISTNMDASFEWYFAPRALLSASVFYMDLKDYVSYGQVTKEFVTYNSTYPEGFLAPYVLTVPINSDGKVKGVELAYEQPIGEHFGFNANYTFADAEADGGGDLVGTSKDTYNIGGYFENDRFNARINYTYRSSFYSGLDRATAFYQDDTDVLNASFGFKATEWLNITLDALNLNEPKLKYYALNRDQPRSIYENGRQYYLNFRFKF